MIDAIVSHVDSQEFEKNVTSALNDLRHEVRQVSGQIARQTYRQQMAIGSRTLRDIHQWRTPKDRRRTIKNARTEFLKASAIAEELGSSELVITAELAIAGCWFLLSSLPDVRHTLDAARQTAETGVLSGQRTIVNRYRQVLYLCRAFGAIPGHCAIPIDPAKAPRRIAAALTVHAPLGAWVELLGVLIRVTAVRDRAADLELSNQIGDTVTLRMRPVDGSVAAIEGGAKTVAPETTVSLGLRLTTSGRQPGSRLAVTVHLPVSWAVPRSRFGPSLAFLLPEPGQAPAVDSSAAQKQNLPAVPYGQYLLPTSLRPYGLYRPQPGYGDGPGYGSPYGNHGRFKIDRWPRGQAWGCSEVSADMLGW